jgi:hypothetical protein
VLCLVLQYHTAVVLSFLHDGMSVMSSVLGMRYLKSCFRFYEFGNCMRMGSGGRLRSLPFPGLVMILPRYRLWLFSKGTVCFIPQLLAGRTIRS